jgi:hypothetical protein
MIPFHHTPDPTAPKCTPVAVYLELRMPKTEWPKAIGPGQIWARCAHCGGSVRPARELPWIDGREGGRPTEDEARAAREAWKRVECSTWRDR